MHKNGTTHCGAMNAGIFKQLGNALHRLEAAWLHSAERSRCFEINTPSEDEGVARMQSVQLNSGHRMPPIGLRVPQLSSGDETYDAVLSALRIGYRHIETAQGHAFEQDIGRAVTDSGVVREEMFLTLRVCMAEEEGSGLKESIHHSLQWLHTPYLDLVLLPVHHPSGGVRQGLTPVLEAWRALEECMAEGLVRSIGFSDAGAPQLEAVAGGGARVAPAVNQVQLTPFNQRRELAEYCRGKGIVLQASSPLCCDRQLAHPTIGTLSKRLGVSPAQLLIRWSLQRGCVPLPSAPDPQHQREHFSVFNFMIPEAEMWEMNRLEEQRGVEGRGVAGHRGGV